MLSLRKLTRAAADQMRNQLKDILSAVGPLLQPKAALGDYVRGVKDPVRGADALFKEIESMYHAVAAEKPFGVRRELTPPLDFSGASVDVIPLRVQPYGGRQRTKQASDRHVAVSMGVELHRVLLAGTEALLAAVSPSNDQLHAFVLHYVTLECQVARQSAAHEHLQSAAL